jgi:DNA repair protein RadC
MDPLTTALTTLLDPGGCDRATALLAHVGAPRGLLRLSAPALVATRLVSAREASRIAAAVELFVHALESPRDAALQHPLQVARAVPHLWTEPLEELWLIPVDPRLRPLARDRVAIGGPERCAVDATELLRRVLLAGASGCFLVHNHPSGDPTPSALDVRFTAELTRRAAQLSLVVHDHVVVGGQRWASCLRDAAGSVLDPLPQDAGPQPGGAGF